MKPNTAPRLLFATLAALAIFALGALPIWAQTASGTVTVQVRDQSGAVLPGAQLKLVSLNTQSVRTGASQGQGSYTFVNVPPGTYSLTVTRHGFQAEDFRSVTVQAAQVTDLQAKLQVGSVTSTVEVSGNVVPLVATTANAIGTTINLQQVNLLPLGGRDITQLSLLIPGAVNSNGITTWDGLPTAAQGNEINGIISSSSRMKFGGNAYPAVSARLEDMSQMTIQTDQLGVNQSSGQNDMQINFITKSGTNQFHGSLFEDFQNSGLNANSWYDNAVGLKRGTLILNDFGGDIGGPIFHNKLFFFASFATSRQPGAYTATADGNGLDGYTGLLTPAAQAGNFTFVDNNGKTQTVNVLTQIAEPNGLPYTLNSEVSSQLQAINAAAKLGAVGGMADPNLENLAWLNPAPVTQYYPAVRLDYDISPKLRLDFNYMETTEADPGAAEPPLPGTFSNRGGGFYQTNYTGGLGLDWTLSPTMVNELRGGFLYDWAANPSVNQPVYLTQPEVNYGVGASGQNFEAPISTFYPVINFTDTVSWQRGSHLLNFGVDFYREQDHYWNNPQGFPIISLGLSSNDPAIADFTGSPYLANAPTSALNEAEALYGTLTGRISSVTEQHAYDLKTNQYYTAISEYPLDELQKSWGLFINDSYHVTSALTLNYGLRWDFTGDDHDLTSLYTSATEANIYGPSGVGHIFQPGVLDGSLDPALTASGHQYNPWNFSPQPNFGLAWNPNIQGGFLGWLFDGQNTVIRGGYSLRDYTEPQQFFWDDATDYGYNYYNSSTLEPATGGAPGTYTPGSLTLGGTFPSFLTVPTTFQKTVPESEATFSGQFGVNGLNYNIRQPYVESWNFGIQRQLGRSNAIEIRYVGNHTVHQWIQLDPNEVNVFSNGFLTEFKAAANNMKINAANSKPGTAPSFADNGYAGQSALPILTTAGVSMTDGTIVTDLNTGAAGAAANYLAGNRNYLCNMIGSATFSPCASVVGAGVAGKYPINFWQDNPYAAGSETNYMTDAGYGNYNSLQVDYRQKQWHGMEFDVNYTWSHTLGVEPGNSWTGSFNNFTMRNLGLAYGPTLYDIPQTFNAYGTYQLPFGVGKALLNSPGILNRVLGNWTVGTIITFQAGSPFQLIGGYQTFNDYADGGVRFTGSTLAALQSSVGVYNTGLPFADTFNPSFLSSPTGGTANASDLVPNTTPGTLASNDWLHGPSFFNQDLSLTKAIAITERWHLQLQGEFLNVYNDVQWGNPNQYIQSPSFGTAGVANSPRAIQLRANITF
ncbi:MAG: carboxypeptidase-like regulatory domain-containing protein [Terriglobales bacterium]